MRRIWNVAAVIVSMAAFGGTGCGSEGDAPLTDASIDAAHEADAGVDAERPDASDPIFEPDPVYSGPTAEIEVIRDTLGIPHIYGQTDEDALFGAGYVQATDRLFQMEMMKRRALGRRAEVLGAGYVSDDTLIRTIRNPLWSRATAARVREEAPADFALMLAWVAGVNRRIDEILSGDAELPYGFGPDELDFQPEPWTTADTFAVMRLILFGNASQIEYDGLATLLDKFATELAFVPILAPLDESFVLPPEERPASGPVPSTRSLPPARAELPADARARLVEWAARIDALGDRGSNNWAMSGEHTANGRSLLAGDPHQSLDSPSVTWAHHLHSREGGGTLDVVGFGFVGTPGVQLGHNEHIGWTATNTYPDIMDLVAVTVRDGATQLGGQTRFVVRREEQLVVRGEDEPRTIFVDEVQGEGVLLPNDLFPLPLTDPGKRVMLAWTGLRPTRDAEVFLGFMRARDMNEFEAAVDLSETACFNFLGADATDIAYRTNVLLPDRGPAETRGEPWKIRNGADPDQIWSRGMVAPSMLPRSRGGERGWITSSNNEPYGFLSNGRVDDDPMYFGVWFDPGARAHRIEEELSRLAERGDVVPADFQALQHDSKSRFAEIALPMLDEAFENVATDEDLEAYRDDEDLVLLHELMNDWDGRMTRDSSAAVAFTGFLHYLAANTIGDDYSLFFDTIYGADIVWTIKVALRSLQGAYPGADMLVQGGRDALVMKSLADTRAWLTTRFGGVDPALYRWSDFHGVRFSPGTWVEDFDQGWVPVDGGDATVNVSNARFFGSGTTPRMRRDVGSGAIFRIVISFREDGTPEALVNFPPGNVESPDSPFFSNTLEDWVEGRYSPLPFSRADVEASQAETFTLAP